MMKKLLPRLISPPRVFIALMIMAILYLLPVSVRSKKQNTPDLLVERAEASNRYACDDRVCGQCCNHGSCVKCPEGDDDPPLPSPPTIAASFLCDLWGGGGWCRNNARLTVTASDPQGYALSIAGTNPDFNCEASCTVGLLAGNHVASYTAFAPASGLSASDSTAWAYDPYPPTASMVITGTLGSNGWYVSPVTVTAGASDSLSGVASARVSNGGAWSSSISLPDGSNTIYTTASDVAGNTATGAPQNIKVDTVAPSISVFSTGVINSNGWYNTSITLSTLVSDATSGVNGSAQISLDNRTTWENTPMDLSAGVYAVQVQAFDVAGNKATAEQTIRIDTAAPFIAITVSGTEGNSGWYTSPVTLTAITSDELSGIADAQYRVNGGMWTAGDSVTLGDGIYQVEFQVSDLAGNASTDQQSVQIDTTSPSYVVRTLGTEGNAGWYVSTATVALSSSDNLSDIASTQYRVNGGQWINGSSASIGDGISTVDFLVRDTAGNSATVSRAVSVDTVPPALTHNIAGKLGNSPWYTSSITITTLTSDSTSGIESTEYRVDSGKWQVGQTFMVGDGMHTIELRTKDQAGNIAQYSFAASIDATAPTAIITTPADGATVAKAVAISGVASDGLSGMQSAQLKIDSSPRMDVYRETKITWDYRWITGYVENGPHTIRLLVTDTAGNIAEDSITLDIENTLPILFWTTPVPTSTPLPSPMPTLAMVVVPSATLSGPAGERYVGPSPWSNIQGTVTAIPAQLTPGKILGRGLVNSWKLYTIVVGLFCIFGLTACVDRRPNAYRRMAKILNHITKNNSLKE